MKKQKLILVLLLGSLFCISLLFTSCNKKSNKYVVYSLDYFDTATAITGYESDREKFDQVSGEILAQ